MADRSGHKQSRSGWCAQEVLDKADGGDVGDLDDLADDTELDKYLDELEGEAGVNAGFTPPFLTSPSLSLTP